MRRWFGNMLRASGRAIALGPRQVGLFAWWCLIDQRISMWTPLLLPLSAASPRDRGRARSCSTPISPGSCRHG
jgi:hypothetical protein